MTHKSSLRQFYVNSKAVLCFGLSLVTSLAPSFSLALEVAIQRTVNLRVHDSSVLKKVGKLAAGSIVSIPDQYVERKDGKVDFESSLNKWLSNSSRLESDPGLKNFTETKKDFYFPIKVVKAAPGSELGNADTYMIALHYLHRKGALLETTADAPIAEAATPEAAPVAETVSPTSSPVSTMNTSAATNFEASVCTDCQAQTQVLHPMAEHLKLALDSHLRTPLWKMNDRTVGHTNTALARFEKTCGMRIENFVSQLNNEIAQSSLRTTLPTALSSPMMLSLMTQETTGNCKESGDGGSSVGLFQVNARSSGYSKSELRNPVINARAALNNLEAKHQALAREFDFNNMSETDKLRLLVSAYNGGEKWVVRAKDDLLQFNRQQGSSLNPNNWEHLRIFYFRRHLNSRNEREAFGTVRGHEQRSQSNALKNLAYTENLIPRSEGSPGVSLQEAWHRRING